MRRWRFKNEQIEENNEKIAKEVEKTEKDSIKKEAIIEVRISLPANLKNEILKSVEYRCENKKCKNPHSFKDKNGEIYLEIHHIKYYSESKKEGLFPHTLQNCIALCANCHKEVHFGDLEIFKDWEYIKKYLQLIK